MKKTVLQIIGGFRQGGSERQAVKLVRLLGDEEVAGFSSLVWTLKEFCGGKSSNLEQTRFNLIAAESLF